MQDPLSLSHDDVDDDSVDENADDAYNEYVQDDTNDENDDDGTDFLQDPLSPPASIHPASPLRLKRAAKTSLGKNVHERQLIGNSKKIWIRVEIYPNESTRRRMDLKWCWSSVFSLTKESVGEY